MLKIKTNMNHVSIMDEQGNQKENLIVGRKLKSQICQQKK